MSSRLSGAASPYLRSHADHPIQWYPWGREAFAAAQSRDVPVFISIGYSTCHWCHVMARESFSDPAIAEIMNGGFVAIKVDREEHPDIDATYMAQASAFTRNLGWPLSIFATPDGAAFHAGTYWPAQSRPGVPSFADVLVAILQAWADRREALDSTAASLADALRSVPEPDAATQLTAANVATAAGTIIRIEDPIHGGFGTTSAKFPLATVLRFLLAAGVDEASTGATDVAEFAFRAMRSSDLFDEVDGGFFRYATNPDWTVPHYERMLVDNAQLIGVALAAGDVETAQRVGAFLRDVMWQSSGGFGTAQDAESIIDGVPSEGGYYALGREHRLDVVAPLVDSKVVTGWNGLAIGVLAALAQRTGGGEWAELAQNTVDALLQHNRTSEGWVRASVDGEPSTAHATPSDLAQLAMGLAELACATGDVSHAVLARDIVDSLRDGDAPAPWLGDPVLADLGVARAPEGGDGDEPSASAALALAAISLANLGAGEGYRALADSIVRARIERASAEPLAFGSTLQAAASLVRPPKQIVVVTSEHDDPLAIAARDMLSDVFVTLSPQQAEAFAAAGFSLFEGKQHPALYVCDNFACELPITEISQLSR